MSLRKEPLVLCATLLGVGLLVYTSLPAKTRAAPRRGSKPSLEVQRIPDVGLATPAARDLGKLSRDLFSPPRDTHPLPLLDIDAPPIAPLKGVFPPPMPGPRPAQYGRLSLREEATPTPVAGLFATDVASAAELSTDQEQPAASALGALGYTGDKKKPAVAKEQDALTSEQRAAQLAGYKQLYDWLRIDDNPPRFGQIRNKDKFALKTRLEERMLFLELDPASGQPLNSGQVFDLERPRVTEFHFAETIANKIQERRREFGEKVTPGQYPTLMNFADECVQSRNEASEALQIAIEMYRLADTVSPNDPAPHLGLARCFELAFDFEAAYAELETVLQKYASSPEAQVRMGELEARLRLFDSAEKRFGDALRGAQQNFAAQEAFGRFLLARGRVEEALEHLEFAHRYEPPAEQRGLRLGVRLELAAARFANGKLDGNDGAAAMYDSALSIEAKDPRALAGKLAIAVVKRGATDDSMMLGRDQAGFEMLLAQGLLEIRSTQWSLARDHLLAAADADPLRAYGAWRALSWLAEVTGYQAEALRYVELALEAAPDDAWSLYQHGRLLFQRDDPEGAAREFKAALDRDLGFSDAIAGLAVIAASQNNFVDADMYFGRALELEPTRAELEARRGYNYLRLNDAARAENCFRHSQELSADEPGARAGLAWCAYRRNDSGKAIEEFRKLDDARRKLPEKDAWRLFANAQIKRIGDHVAKEAWEDNFDRSGNAGSNQWDVEEAAGATFSLSDNAMHLRGPFRDSNARARLLRRYQSKDFVSIEMDVTVASVTSAHVGVFVTREKQGGRGNSQPTSWIAVERHPEGGLQVLLMDRATAEPKREDIAPVGGVPWWPLDKPVRLRIERIGEGSDSIGRISVDGVPVADGFSMRSIGSAGDVCVGLMAWGDNGQPVEITIDNVQIVKSRAP